MSSKAARGSNTGSTRKAAGQASSNSKSGKKTSVQKIKFSTCISVSRKKKCVAKPLKTCISSKVAKTVGKGVKRVPDTGLYKPINVIDPILEKIDPHPDIQLMFLDFDKRFFRGVLRRNNVTVSWTRRLKSSVGSCSDAYPPKISLSEPILKLRPRKDTTETLLHEMIHAYLAVAPGQYEDAHHGPKFHRHMKRIDRLAGTKLKVDHDFHDEADKQRYIWMCNGICKKEVANCYNKPPTPLCSWWVSHREYCGGVFVLVQTPISKTPNNT